MVFRMIFECLFAAIPGRLLLVLFVGLGGGFCSRAEVHAGPLLAGAAKVDITNDEAGPAEGRLHVRSLVLTQDDTTAVLLTLDVVAIGEIGYVKNDYLPNVR
ncbi:MAG: hypothetical protein KDA52_14395, partial [Planctomycetaceae bacterium]|nr:hypothetical protein [Planctomycetaceae bacterium]